MVINYILLVVGILCLVAALVLVLRPKWVAAVWLLTTLALSLL